MQPEPAYANFFAELARDRPISELRIRAILRESKAQLNKVSSAHAAFFYHVIGVASWRLGNFQAVIDAENNATRLAPRDGTMLGTLGAALMAVGRHKEAIDALLRALELIEETGGDALTTLANLSEVFWRLGDREGALEAFRGAQDVSAEDSAADQLMLANQAAELGAYRDSLRFFSKFLSLHRGEAVSVDELTGARALTDGERSILQGMRGLNRMMARLDDLQGGMPDLMRTEAPVHSERSGEGAVSVLGETRELRARANLAMLEHE